MIREITDKKIWVAPLAGITDKAYREICKRKGADVIMSEMVSADGLVFSREKSLEYAYFNETQRPFGIQIFGNDPDIMAKGAEIALSENPDFIDINMGCPVKKVVKRGAGSALMKTPELAIRIVKSVKKVLAGRWIGQGPLVDIFEKQFQKKFTRFVDTNNEPEVNFYKDTNIILEHEQNVPSKFDSPGI